MKGIFLGYDEEGEMDYMIWVPQLQKVVASRVFSLMRLSWLNLFVPLRNITKRLDFSIRASQWYSNVPQLEQQKAENHDEHIVMLPEGGQPLNAPGVHGQLMNNAENRDVHGQQPI